MRDFLTFKWSPDFRVTFPFLVVVLMLVSLSGCSTFGGPVAAAETAEQKAFAVYGEFVIAKELAADIVEDEGVPLSVRRAIRDANNKVTPVAQSLKDLALEVEEVREQVATGESTEAQLSIVTANLVSYLDTGDPNSVASVIQRFIDSVRDD